VALSAFVRRTGVRHLTVNSAYRNPSKQYVIDPQTPNSRHVYGDAVDFSAPPGSSLRADVDKIKSACGACREPMYKTPTWIHYDWRGQCPPEW
jgi:uncharacterized protein YcbK (DUF882 family)